MSKRQTPLNASSRRPSSVSLKLTMRPAQPTLCTLGRPSSVGRPSPALPPGSSSTPDKGKIGSVSGSCSKLGSKGLRPGTRSVMPARRSGEQDGRQPLAAVDGERIGEAQRLEELQKLLAGGFLVPLAVGLDHGEQLVDRFLALVVRPIGHREIETGLHVLWI